MPKSLQYGINVTSKCAGKPKIRDSIVAFALLQWSGSKPAICLRYACDTNVTSGKC